MAARLTVLALAASAGAFLDDEDAERVRRACRHWRRAAELTPRLIFLPTYVRTLRGLLATDEQRLTALHSVKEFFDEICPARDGGSDTDPVQIEHFSGGVLNDVTNAVLAIAVAGAHRVPLVGAALDALVAVRGCSIPARDHLIWRRIQLELCAALKQHEETREATAIELQRLILRALVLLCAKPWYPSRLSVLPEVPWERFLHSPSPNVVDAMVLLATVSDGPIDVTQAVLNAGVLPLVVNCAKAGVAVLGCLRVLGNICSGIDVYAQAVINAGGVDVLASQLTSDVPSILKEASWALSNIAAGNVDQIDALIKHPTIVRDVLANFTCAWPEVRKESVWTIANIASAGSRQQLRILIEEHAVVEAMCGIAAATADVKMAIVALEAVGNCLHAFECLKREQGLAVNALVTRLRATAALIQLQSLSHHTDTDVVAQVRTLRERYFEAGEEDDLCDSGEED